MSVPWFGVSTSPFSSGGHVLQTLFPEPSDGGGGRRTHRVSALLLVLCPTVSLHCFLFLLYREPTIRHKSKYQKVATQEPGEARGSGESRHDVTVTSPRAHVRTLSRSKLKTVKLTLTVILCYLICWGPFFIAQMWAAWDPHAPFTGQ